MRAFFVLLLAGAVAANLECAEVRVCDRIVGTKG